MKAQIQMCFCTTTAPTQKRHVSHAPHYPCVTPWRIHVPLTSSPAQGEKATPHIDTQNVRAVQQASGTFTGEMKDVQGGAITTYLPLGPIQHVALEPRRRHPRSEVRRPLQPRSIGMQRGEQRARRMRVTACVFQPTHART